MATLSAILDHYDRSAFRPDAPQAFANQHRKLDVLGSGASGSIAVRVFKYHMNTDDPRGGVDPAGRISNTGSMDEFRDARGPIESWVRTASADEGAAGTRARTRLAALQMISASGAAPVRLRRVFLGKGSPRDIALALSLLAHSGLVARHHPGSAEKVALQQYADRYMGVDCSGFVNNYFTAIGRRAHDLVDRPGISTYARPGRRLRTIPGSPRNHVFCWLKGESRTSARPHHLAEFSHIVLVDDWVSPPGANGDPVHAVLRVSQSGSSLGGICTGLYEILRAPAATDARCTWRIRRLAHGGDFNLNPTPPTAWNEVFLAPPV